MKCGISLKLCLMKFRALEFKKNIWNYLGLNSQLYIFGLMYNFLFKWLNIYIVQLSLSAHILSIFMEWMFFVAFSIAYLNKTLEYIKYLRVDVLTLRKLLPFEFFLWFIVIHSCIYTHFLCKIILANKLFPIQLNVKGTKLFPVFDSVYIFDIFSMYELHKIMIWKHF